MEANWYEHIDLPDDLPQRPEGEFGVVEIPGSRIKFRKVLIKETICGVCTEPVISFERGRWVHVGDDGRRLDHEHLAVPLV